MTSAKHRARVRSELRQAGITSFGLLRSEARYLPDIIYDDESIGGAIYGVDQNGWCMLVATEKRVIYLDKKPFFITKDIITYDVVSSVQSNVVGPFSTVTLSTRGEGFSLRFVSAAAAKKFVDYIEKRRLSGGEYDVGSGRFYREIEDSKTIEDVLDDASRAFIGTQETAVLSTVDRKGQPHGAVVHYVFDGHFIYILTRSESNKARNIMQNGRAALTIHESGSLKTAQLTGAASVETDDQMKQDVFYEIVRERHYSEGAKQPPVTSLEKGLYMVLRFQPTAVLVRDYAKKS